MTSDDRKALTLLDERLRVILPEEYQSSDEDMQPVAMGSAGLKFDQDGNVAWDQIWASFCDLAMAGGPPHKGTLLEPASTAEIDANAEQYETVAEEICRGITMATDLDARVSSTLGWLRVACYSETMAGWLLRAIVVENIAAHGDGRFLFVPASPHFRLEKEIKNVVTAIAKTSHYWLGHMPRAQQRAMADLFAIMAVETPLVQPARSDERPRAELDAIVVERMAGEIRQGTGLQPSSHRYDGWLGMECAGARTAIWMMRALVVSNILSRREGTVIFVPINPASDPAGARVVRTLIRVHRLAAARVDQS